jgi:hypothetical protein
LRRWPRPSLARRAVAAIVVVGHACVDVVLRGWEKAKMMVIPLWEERCVMSAPGNSFFQSSSLHKTSSWPGPTVGESYAVRFKSNYVIQANRVAPASPRRYPDYAVRLSSLSLPPPADARRCPRRSGLLLMASPTLFAAPAVLADSFKRFFK